MSMEPELKNPWMIAVWPGMGNVALTAGYYLMAKLDMELLEELDSGDYELEQVEIDEGIMKIGRRPRDRFFLWRDPKDQHDILLFIGEAQPALGKYRFCKQIMDYAKERGVQRVFTFAAMATQMRPDQPSRVISAAADQPSLEELKRLEIEILEDGQIRGLNGILLGVAAEEGLGGACLLGEMPHIFAQLPYPKASLAVLEAFTKMMPMDLDFTELATEAELVDEQLEQLLNRVEGGGGFEPQSEEFQPEPSPEEEETLSPNDEQKIERLFREAAENRSKAYELKGVLDQLGVFDRYEDRFLDLFKKE